MEINVIKGLGITTETPLLVVGIYSKDKKLTPAVAAIDTALGGKITQIVSTQEFRGEREETMILHTFGKIKAERILLVGLGKKQDLQPEAVRVAVGAAIRGAKKARIQNITFCLPTFGFDQIPSVDAGLLLAETAILADYEYRTYLTETENLAPYLDTLTLLSDKGKKLVSLRKGVVRGEIQATAVNYARELVNGPSNFITPDYFVAEAKRIATENKFKLTVLDKKAMEKMGAGCFTAVAKGSKTPAYLIVIEAIQNKKPPVVLVGKGVTFDSGGISIKPSKGMKEMKMDMAGAATVLAVMTAITKLKVKENVVAIMPVTDNMPDGDANKPGDIYKALNGKTVEINSTDAEGRLILADALAYAVREYKPQFIIDLATLTGACVVALGHIVTAVMGNHAQTVDRIMKAGDCAGERYWALPLYPEYKELLKSKYADILNNGDQGAAGTITGAIFLREFVGDTHWAHLDIAGTGMENKGTFKYMSKGATGVGVRTLLQLLTD